MISDVFCLPALGSLIFNFVEWNNGMMADMDIPNEMYSGVTAVLVDLSGTLHIDDFAIPGAPEALQL